MSVDALLVNMSFVILYSTQALEDIEEEEEEEEEEEDPATYLAVVKKS